MESQHTPMVSQQRFRWKNKTTPMGNYTSQVQWKVGYYTKNDTNANPKITITPHRYKVVFGGTLYSGSEW
jgi:hypothetical protein